LSAVAQVFSSTKVKTMTVKTRKDIINLLFFLALVPAASLYAAETLKPGGTAVTNTEPSADPGSAPQTLASQIQQSLALVSELERLGGPYADKLGEAYLELGNMLAAEGKHEEALSGFEKALHFVRINNGLNHPAQLKILESMINSGFALESWDYTDDQIHLYWHITSRSFASGSVERQQALAQLQSWQSLAAAENLITVIPGTLEETTRLYEVEIGSFEQTGTPDPESAEIKAALLLGKAELLYQRAVLTESRPLSSFRNSSVKMTTQRQCMPSRQPSGRITQVCIATTAPNIDYYVDQTRNKDMAIFGYLNEMKASVLEAYEVLMQIETMSSDKLFMLTRVHGMTRDFNEMAARYQRPLAHAVGSR
jgi:tetratricopeptide (TPR) repeat protein